MYSVTHKIVHGTVETLCITLCINLTIHLIYLQIILQPSSVNCYNLSARRVSTIKNLNNFAAFKQSFFYKHKCSCWVVTYGKRKQKNMSNFWARLLKISKKWSLSYKRAFETVFDWKQIGYLQSGRLWEVVVFEKCGHHERVDCNGLLHYFYVHTRPPPRLRTYKMTFSSYPWRLAKIASTPEDFHKIWVYPWRIGSYPWRIQVYPWRISWKLRLHPQRIPHFLTLPLKKSSIFITYPGEFHGSSTGACGY